MFGMFNSIKDMNYVRVTKETMAKIEALFASKERIINDQASEVQKLKNLLLEQSEELNTLRKYKENDDLVYAYENMCEGYKKEVKELTQINSDLSSGIQKASKKIDTAMSMESVYLEAIHNLKNTIPVCPEYETVGENLLKIYA